MKFAITFAVVVAILLALASAVPTKDIVTSLPMFNGTFPSMHYSGYLDGNNGAHLHYYFVEASDAPPASAPVVVWMNGGPGCSSMDGWGYELGPFHFKDDGASGPVFELNSQTWTKYANVIFLEAPPGVGFSYRDNGNYTISDTENAANNYAALVNFFDKFPEFKKNKFYVSGESYGGVYVPTLVAEILNNGGIPQFAGMLVGNGCTSCDCDNFVEGDLKFAAYHDLIPFSLYEEGKTKCSNGSMASAGCATVQDKYYGEFMANVNPYGVYYKCFAQPTYNWKYIPSLRRRLVVQARRGGYGEDLETYLHDVIEGPKKQGAVPPSPPGGNVPCIDSVEMTKYLNRADVKAAIHVASNLDWAICSNIPYKGNVKNVAYIYEMLHKRKIPTLVYNGNIDTSVPYTTVMAWMNDNAETKKSIDFNVTTPMHPWTFVDPLYSFGKQLGGYATKYNDFLWFTTINGAGHMVPQFRPAAAFDMFKRFLGGVGF